MVEAANAYVIDGSGLPTPSPGFIEAAVKDFIVPTLGGSYTGIALPTPAQLVGIDQSVQDGLSNLQAVMGQQQRESPGRPYVVFGFSQGTVIQMLQKQSLAERRADDEPIPDVTFVGIGVANRPNGGMGERLNGLVVPFLDYRFNGSQPTDTGIRSIDIVRQYDLLGDAPAYPVALFAFANAVLGVIFVHALYKQVSLDPTSERYVPGTIIQQHGDTTYYFIPTAELPLLAPLRIAGLSDRILAVIEPLLSVLVEAGYDRSVPFGEPTPMQLIPSTDPVTLGLQVADAAMRGADSAAALVGGRIPGRAALSRRLRRAEEKSANQIGRPYGRVVAAINKAFNPIQAFNRIEGALVSEIDDTIDRLGLTKAVNSAIGATVSRAAMWAEAKYLYPQPLDQ